MSSSVFIQQNEGSFNMKTRDTSNTRIWNLHHIHQQCCISESAKLLFYVRRTQLISYKSKLACMGWLSVLYTWSTIPSGKQVTARSLPPPPGGYGKHGYSQRPGRSMCSLCLGSLVVLDASDADQGRILQRTSLDNTPSLLDPETNSFMFVVR